MAPGCDGTEHSGPATVGVLVIAKVGTEEGTWKRALLEAANLGASVTVDLGQVEVLDSAALGLLLSVHRQLRQHGSRLQLHDAGASMERVLRISGLKRLFDR